MILIYIVLLKEVVKLKMEYQAEKEAYNRLVRDKYSNTKLKGFYEQFDLKDFAIDTVTDPLTILSIIAAPFTGGMSLAAKTAATAVSKNGAKR